MFEGIGRNDDTLPASLGGMSLSDMLMQFGGGQGGQGAGPNPSGGVAGSQNPSSGLIGGLLGGDLSSVSGVDVTGSLLGAAVGQLMGGVPAGTIAGIVGTLAQQGAFGPSFGNVNAGTAIDVSNSLNAGAIAASDAAFADPGSTAQARAQAAEKAASDYSQGLGSNPGIQGSTGLSGSAQTGATSDAAGSGTGGVDSGGSGTGVGGTGAGSDSTGSGLGGTGAAGGLTAKGGIIKGPTPKNPEKDNLHVSETGQGLQSGEGVLSKEAMTLLGKDALHLINGIANSNASRMFKMMALHKALTVR